MYVFKCTYLNFVPLFNKVTYLFLFYLVSLVLSFEWFSAHLGYVWLSGSPIDIKTRMPPKQVCTIQRNIQKTRNHQTHKLCLQSR